jgi:hypothetical protein
LICPDNRWSNWQTTQSNCVAACQPQTQIRTDSCANGYVGSVTWRRDKSCPSGQWGNWRISTSNCSRTCVTASETISVNCPNGQSGSITRSRSFTCPQTTWGPWVEINTCQ